MSQFYPQAAMALTVIWEDYVRGQADDSKAETMLVIPESVTVKINDYKTADTVDVELDYNHFPFDPRTIRSLGITIYMQDMAKLATGDDRITPSYENTIFNGFADVANIELDDDSRQVKFTGRDFTCLFLDAKWDGTLLNLGKKPVDDVIRDILKRLPSVQKMEVINRTDKKVLPTLAGISGTNVKDKRSASADETYWDVIQDVVGRAGLIAYVEIDELILTTPNALYKKEEAKQFIYGRNVSSLKLERKIGRMKDVNIRLLSPNLRADSPVLEAFIPKDATASFRKIMKLPADHLRVERNEADLAKPKSGKGSRKPTDENGNVEREIAPMVTFRIPNAKNKAQLVAIGEEIFAQMSRQQIEGSLSTREMAVRSGDEVEFDVTKMRIGTALEVRIDNDDLAGIRTIDSESMRYDYLIDKGYSDRVAAVLSKTMSGFESPFYTRSITLKCSGDSGFSCDIDFINFIELSEKLLTGDFSSPAAPAPGGGGGGPKPYSGGGGTFKGNGATGSW